VKSNSKTGEKKKKTPQKSVGLGARLWLVKQRCSGEGKREVEKNYRRLGSKCPPSLAPGEGGLIWLRWGGKEMGKC